MASDSSTSTSWLAFPGTRDIRYHPYFQGAISRWAWRFYTHRLTRAGRWFFWPTVLFAAIGSSSLELQVYVPFLYAFGLWAIAVLAAVACRPRVGIRSRHADRVCAGETVPVDVIVEHRGWMPAADLNVLPHGLPPSLDAIPPEGAPVPPLARGGSATVRLGLRCNRRGVHVRKGWRVETDFPFGLLNAYRIVAEERALLVYPRFTRLDRLEIPAGWRHHPGGVALISQLGESLEFLGNRDYREGDHIRDIDWRATARLDTPVLREWSEEFFLRVAVILDTHVPRSLTRQETERRRALFERAVSLSAAVSDYMARQEYVVDLFAAGAQIYHLTAAGRSPAYLDEVLDILACVEESAEEPFRALQPAIVEHLGQVNTVFCVFLDWNDDRRAFARMLGQSGAGVKALVVRDAPGPPGAGETGIDLVEVSAADIDAGITEL